jgi:hypothetical protein
MQDTDTGQHRAIFELSEQELWLWRRKAKRSSARAHPAMRLSGLTHNGRVLDAEMSDSKRGSEISLSKNCMCIAGCSLEDDIGGLLSEAVRRGYTHHELEILENAMSKMPSLNSKEEKTEPKKGATEK